MLTNSFMKAAFERAIKTFAQTLVALAGTNAIDVLSLNIGDSLKAAGAAAALSILTSIASNGIGAAGPSLAGETLSDY